MDRYKKTTLKFDKNLGYGRNLRAAEINSSRALNRNSRFSMLRCLEPEQEKKPQSRIPAYGKPGSKGQMTREQMLQKWKEEKDMKTKLQLQNKKPVFKIGVTGPKSGPVCSPFSKATPDSTFVSSKNSQKISFNAPQVSKGKENFLKPPSTSRLPGNITYRNTPTNKESHPQLGNSKLQLSKPGNLSNTMNLKESQVKTLNFKPATTHSSNLTSKKELQIKPLRSNLKPANTNYGNSSEKKESKIQVVVTKPPTTNTSSNSSAQKIKTPSLAKPTETKVHKKPEQVQLSLPGRVNKVPESKLKPVSYQNTGRTLKAPSKIAAPARSGIPNKFGLKPKQDIKTNKKEEPSDPNITFSCNISQIEPVEESLRLSFAPKDFTFNMGAELSFSYLNEGPVALYNMLKTGEERTSTPKRKEIIEIQRKEAENAKLETEEKNSEVEKVPDPQVPFDKILEVLPKKPEIEKKVDPQVEKSQSEVEPVSKLQVGKNKSELEVSDLQVTHDVKAKFSLQQNASTSSEYDSKLTEAVTKILTEEDVSILISKEFIAIEEKSEVNHSLNMNSLENKEKAMNLQSEKSVGNIKEALLFVEESKNSSLANSSDEEKIKAAALLETNPTVAILDTLELKEDIPSTTLNNKANISVEKIEKEGSGKLHETIEWISDDTRTSILDKVSPISALEKKENISDVFVAGQNIIISENVKMQNNLGNESVELRTEPHNNVEELGAFAIPDAPSSSGNQFKVPVFDNEKITVAKKRTSSRVSQLRSARKSEMPKLESISESIEGSSPCKTPPKPPKTPKTRKSTISEDFTPRRSLRLARNSVLNLNATENLFDVRLSLCQNSPDTPGNSSTWDASKITYDFDKLDIEETTEAPPTPQRRTSSRINKKVSLLYTPPQAGRVSTLRKSIRGDLMSFSPDMSEK